MAAREKLNAVRRSMFGSESSAQLRRAGMAGVNFLMGFLMASAKLANGASPFGIAAAAQAGAGLNGVCCLAGACLGYLVSGGMEVGIRYLAGAVMVFTIVFITQDAQFARRAWFAPSAAMLVTAATGVLGSIASASGLAEAILGVAGETLLAGGAVIFFREAMSDGDRTTEAEETRHNAAVALSAACALMALSRLTLLDLISLGRLAALLAVMTAANRAGSMAGATGGTLFGLAMDAAGGGSPFFTMAYAFSGLMSGFFARAGRLPFTVVFVLANALCVFVTWDSGSRAGPVCEAFVASVVFMLIPSGALTKLSAALEPVSPGAGESGLRKYAARRVDGIARAYSDVCEVVRRTVEPANDNDVAKVFDRAADAACVKCCRRDECWTRGYIDTLDALNNATAAMLERGRLEEGDIPEHFRSRCPGLDAFVAAVNGELRASAYRKQYRSRLEESRAAAWSQYADFAVILGGVSRELGSMNGSDPLAERRLRRFLQSLDIEADVSVFRDAGGRLRAVIESGRLTALTSDPAYLDRLASVLGTRLCRPNTGAEGRLTLLEAEPLAVSVGIAAMKKKGENVSGDRGTYFKTDSGTLCVILSDGMGTGRDAAKESIEAISILERFLRSGVDPATAMKVLNSVMLLRNGEEWGFATVDLMCVDLFSGEACFYKYGAAPSYVRNGKMVRRIAGESLAAGLVAGDGAPPDVVKMRLRPGSLALIASDGVMPGESDGWLRDMLRGQEDDMKSLARAVVRKAADEYGNSDDMTVLTVRVDARAR